MKPVTQALLRSFCVQGCWNYRGMQHLGLLWSQLPLLPEDEELRKAALRRSFEFYNGHPYLCGFLLGAARDLEAQGKGEKLSRLKRAAVSPLGASGDRLFWVGLKPLAGTLACLALLGEMRWPGRGLIWLPALFFLLYNLVHVYWRQSAFKQGLQLGLGVHAAIRDLGSHTWLRRVPRSLAFAAGFGAPLLLLPVIREGGWTQAGALLAVLLISWQLPRGRWALPVLLALLAFVWMFH